MNNHYYKWILDCVHDYFSFKSRTFESEELRLKLGIYKNMDNDYYIEFKVGEKISILTGNEKLSKGQMIDLLEHSFSKDFQYPKTVDIDKIYNFISKSVYSLDGTYRQAFRDKELDIKIQIYTHALSSESFDYWIKANGKSEKIYLNTNCKLAEDLIDQIYSSYINDFIEHNHLVNDSETFSNHMKNKNHILQLQLEDKDRQIYELKDNVSYLQAKVSDLKRINESIILDNNNKTKECYELRNEVKRLGERLQEEKNAHTTTQCRAIFAKHILNGDRDENVIEHMETYGV